MTEEPSAPGASAIILYREVYRDDMGKNSPVGGNVYMDYSNRTPHEDDYYRIKILTEEGRKYADVEIPYDREVESIVKIHARTIKPDGTIVDFDGKVFNKTVVKARGVKFLAKTFTLPAVQAGCVIEYFYTDDLNPEYIITESHWILSNELFIKSANFAFKPLLTQDYRYGVNRVWQNLPPGTAPPTEDPDGTIRLHASNIPAFPTEDLMPPENEVKARVDFTYLFDAPETEVKKYWSKAGKRLDTRMESFVGKPKSLEDAVAGIVGPHDPPEVKLQKLYARVQQMRNTTFESRKTEEEEKRAKEKAPTNAEEVWKRGYGNQEDLTWLYLALVRAAGFEANGILVADRENYFFDPNLMLSGRLKSNLVVVKLNGKDVYCNPGAPFTPFGLLPWNETGLQGMQLDKKESTWVPTLVPTADQARTERRANLTLSETGDLEGTLTVTYTGIEAARLRLEERHADDTERKKYLEDIVKGYISAASEEKLTNQPDWKNPELPLVAELSIKVPAWASAAGRHLLLPASLFGAHEKFALAHADRIYPIYVEYPYLESDDINIQMPAGWQISSLPKGWKDTGRVVTYNLSAENNNGKLHLERTLTVNFIFLDKKYYSALRDYFQEIKTTDEQQIVLDPGAARAQN